MHLIVDLHTHSHYSRATSKNSTLEELYRWGKIKGINVIGTGDFTHPAWFLEIADKLEPAEPGLYKLKDSFVKKIEATLPVSVRDNPLRFILTVEISNIYSKNGKVRKLHNLVVAPNLEVGSAINSQLGNIGNLKADGRPILGLDSKKLLEILLKTDPNILYIPAHIWTPWFAMFGSHSGFDSIAEAFEDLTPEVRVIETGLSSDPFMNWRVKELANISIISNSDAHSPEKLGREATLVDTNLDYFDIIQGLKTNDQRLIGTIEFFPQEGMYHYDGHRDHQVRLSPTEAKKLNNICPVCHKPLTIGVDHRVDDLASLPADFKPAKHKVVEYIIPLKEVIGETKKVGPTSKAVDQTYHQLITHFGSEFTILRQTSLEQIKEEGFPNLALALEKMRQGEVSIEPGYDGVYGTIKIFKEGERKSTSGQISLL